MSATVTQIRICLGSSCYSRGNAENLPFIRSFIDQHGLDCRIDFKGHLCNEKCNRGPVIEIGTATFEAVTPASLYRILCENLLVLPK